MVSRIPVLLATAALLAGCGTSAPHAAPSGTATNGGTPARLRTTADNVAATHAESHRLLTVLTPPPGGKVEDSAPVRLLRHEQVGIGPSDPAFSEHAWWTVPMSTSDFRAWLRSRHVAGLTSEDGGSSSSSDGWTVDFVDFHGADTPAYVRPVLNLSFLPYDGGVAVRLDTFTAARFARTVLVPTDTTRVSIRLTITTFNPRQHRRVRRASVTDPQRISRLVTAANALNGAMTVPFVSSCPAQLSRRTYVVTFAGPHGSYSITGDDSSCWPTLTLRHDGAVVPPRLDPGRHWFSLLGI